MAVEKCPECGRMCRRRGGLYYCPTCDESFNGRTIGQRIEEGFRMLADDYADDCGDD